MRTKEKAAIWLPKAEKIKTLSAGFMAYLDSVRFLVADTTEDSPSATDIFIRKGLGKDVHDRLVNYKTQLLAVHPQIHYALGELINRYLFNIDSLLSPAEYQQAYFTNVSREEAISFLTLLQNKTLMAANTGLAFCNEQFTFHGDSFDVVEAIVGQNANVLEVGDVLEITAGLGSFSNRKMPKITIDRQPVPLNERGYVVYKMKTSVKRGRYSVPVQIEFLDEDGKKQTRTFNVEYRLVRSIN